MGVVRIDKIAPRGLRVGMTSVSLILTDNGLMVESSPLPLPSVDEIKVDTGRDDEDAVTVGGTTGCGLQFINGEDETTAVELAVAEEDDGVVATLPLDFVRRIPSTPLFSCTSPSRYSKVYVYWSGVPEILFNALIRAGNHRCTPLLSVTNPST